MRKHSVPLAQVLDASTNFSFLKCKIAPSSTYKMSLLGICKRFAKCLQNKNNNNNNNNKNKNNF